MLIPYILNHLKQSNLTEPIQDSIKELFSNIKKDEALLSEFTSMDSHTFISKLTLEDFISEDSEDSLDTLHTSTSTFTSAAQTQAANQMETTDRLLSNSILDSIDSETFDALTAPSTPIVLRAVEKDSMASPLSESMEMHTLAMEHTSFMSTSPLSNRIGRYINLGVLGEGGMGEVRKVRDEILNRNLAMKIVHPSMLSNRKALARFFEEAQIGAQLQHPNIIPIHEFGELDDGRLYFTMKEINGVEFSHCIKDVHKASSTEHWHIGEKGYSFRQLIQSFHKVCETIAYAHSVEVIHRDLKPENIMIGDFGEVLVVDWGIAKVLNKDEPILEDTTVQIKRSEENAFQTRMGMVSGTPTYMSPEQAKGRIDLMGTHTDIYSLGAILYEILSGKLPYTGNSALEILKKVRSSRPPSLLTTDSRTDPIELPNVEPLVEYTGKIPQPLIEICDKAMEREISSRYQTASELANDIFHWLEGAQKRDKALKEYTVALELLKESEDLKIESKQYWTKANTLTNVDGSISDDGWEHWKQATLKRQRAKTCHEDYRSTLQGALVYDPELKEANEALAELLIQDIIHAIAIGSVKERKSLERLRQRHLQHLSQHSQQSLLQMLSDKCNDDIVLLRARRGELVGRQAIRTSITETLQHGSRVVSLIGPAGVGKSRLALEAIYDLQDSESTTYFCNLTEANSELSAARIVAKAMNIQLRSIDPIGQLSELFVDQPYTLVLDNLEQVIKPIQQIIGQWITQSDSLRIIATSRIKLRLPEETSFQIHPLTPLESIEVFIKRGQIAKPNFTVHNDNKKTIERIITRLDNLPLAIELAAARLKLFNVDEIEHRLHERFSFLRSRNTEIQALQGALDWSWDLLKPWEKALLSQISVFRGGFELTAVEQIFNCGGWKEMPPVVDILQDLCDDSLLLQNHLESEHIRYGILESVRQYAHAQLQNPDSIEHGLSGPEALRQTQQRHAEHYAQFGEMVFLDQLDDIHKQKEWGQFFEELENLIVAIEYGDAESASNCCLGALKILGMKGPASLGVDITNRALQKDNIPWLSKNRLNIAHSRFLRISGHVQEARRGTKDEFSISVDEVLSPYTTDSASISQRQPHNLLNKFQDSNTPSTPTLAEQRLKAEQLVEQGNIEETESLYARALRKYQQALNIYQQIDYAKGIASTLLKIGGVHRSITDYQGALQTFERSFDIAKTNDLPLLVADSLTEMGKIYLRKGEYQKSIEHFEQSLEVTKEIEDLFRQERNLGSIGVVLESLGEYQRSIQYCTEAIAINRTVGNRRNEGIMLGNLGMLYTSLGEYTKAQTHLQQALKISQEIGNKSQESLQLGNLGLIFDSQGEYDKAIETYQTSLKVCQEIGDKYQEGLSLGNLGESYIKLQQWDKAEEYLCQAIEICHTALPTAAGAFSGSLAWMYGTQKQQLVQALKLLKTGEPLVAMYPLEHAKFLCKKATLLYMSNQQEEAFEALQQAKNIKISLQTENKELIQLISESTAILSPDSSTTST